MGWVGRGILAAVPYEGAPSPRRTPVPYDVRARLATARRGSGAGGGVLKEFETPGGSDVASVTEVAEPAPVHHVLLIRLAAPLV